MTALPGDPRLGPRFWRKVIVINGCWVWRGATSAGYGRCTVNKRPLITHRLAYESLVGPIPAGLQLDHLCRNPPCCNPAHLEPVTGAENIRRGLRANQTHCKRGHPLSGANLYVNRGHRVCVACKTERYYRTRGLDSRKIARAVEAELSQRDAA